MQRQSACSSDEQFILQKTVSFQSADANRHVSVDSIVSMHDSWWCKLWQSMFPSRPAAEVQLLVPFYVWPDAVKFAELAEGGDKVKAVIVGPTSGPPTADDPNTGLYTQLFGRLVKGGIGLVGYVHVSYGRRPMAKVLDEIKLWYSGYGSILSGIFVDEIDSTDIETTRRHVISIRKILDTQKTGQILVLNPGSALDHSVCKLVDIVLSFENSMAVWCAEQPNSTRGQLPSACGCTTAAAVHSTGGLTQKQVTQQLLRASDLGYSHVYFTDGSMPNPWATLPSYWRSQVTAVLQCQDEI